MEWERLWPECSEQNLLQSWFYGESKADSDNLEVTYLALVDKSEIVSIVQILIKKIPFAGSLVRINRGPIVVGEINENEKNKILVNSIITVLQECKRRRWLMLQIAPELSSSEEMEGRLKHIGLRKLSAPAWASGLLPIGVSEEDILMSFNGKWRNCLRKGWKLGVKASLSSDLEKDIQVVNDFYKNLQKDKNFVGLSESLLQTMSQKRHRFWNFNIFFAKSKEKGRIEDILGILVSVDYGDKSMYLIGVTSKEGRKLQANYVLLWEAILEAKRKGCIFFDIGGLNETTPLGIAHFKKGIKAVPYSLVGEWRAFNIPKFF